MSWWIKSLIRYSPDGGGGGGGDAEAGSDAGAGAGGNAGAGAGNGEPDPNKYVPLDKHRKVSDRLKNTEAELAKYKQAEADAEKAKLSEIDRYKAEIAERDAKLAEDAAKLADLTQKQDKAEKLAAALDKIGDGFHIHPDDMPRLRRIIERMAYNPETIAEDIAEAVMGMRKPKGTPGSLNNNAPEPTASQVQNAMPDPSKWPDLGSALTPQKK